jgi:hypothetical protein
MTDSIKKFNESLENLKNDLPSILVNIVDKLIELTDKNKIELFSFRDSEHQPNLTHSKNFYMIKIESPSIKNGSNFDSNYTYLGTFESLKDIPHLKIPKNLLKELEEINSTLLLLNEYLNKFLPPTKMSHYSNRTLREDITPEQKERYLNSKFPSFYHEMKNKLEEKSSKPKLKL